MASEHLREQIRQMVREVGHESLAPFSRCNACNERLVPVDKNGVIGRVPAYVYEHQERFSVCPVCGRYYWQGTHWHIMHREIEIIVEGMRDGDR